VITPIRKVCGRTRDPDLAKIVRVVADSVKPPNAGPDGGLASDGGPCIVGLTGAPYVVGLTTGGAHAAFTQSERSIIPRLWSAIANRRLGCHADVGRA
jgi:hypothetical protein